MTNKEQLIDELEKQLQCVLDYNSMTFENPFKKIPCQYIMDAYYKDVWRRAAEDPWDGCWTDFINTVDIWNKV